MNKKIYYGNATQEQQKHIENFISREIYCNQTLLVDDLLGKDILSYDEIENLYPKICQNCEVEFENDRCPGCGRYQSDNQQEIFEWYCVSDWLAKKLAGLGEPVLFSDYGTWWGRTCTGQAIYLDPTVWDVVFNYKKDSAQG